MVISLVRPYRATDSRRVQGSVRRRSSAGAIVLACRPAPEALTFRAGAEAASLCLQRFGQDERAQAVHGRLVREALGGDPLREGVKAGVVDQDFKTRVVRCDLRPLPHTHAHAARVAKQA